MLGRPNEMASPNRARAAPAIAGSNPVDVRGSNDSSSNTTVASLQKARASRDAVRLSAWRRIRWAIDEQIGALQQRLDAKDPNDIHLRADLRTFTDLGEAIADLWATGRAA